MILAGREDIQIEMPFSNERLTTKSASSALNVPISKSF
jgi:hypothetical protein